MTRLYLSTLPTDTTDRATGETGSQIQQAGLVEGSGRAVENIATQNVDFSKRGRIQYGRTLSRKFAEELDSLSESAYTALPLYDPGDESLGRKRGYYEIEQIDVTPAQEARDDVYEYDATLTNAGTREDSRRAVQTNPEAVSTPLASGSPEPISIPASATGVRWYDDANGTEPATVDTTVTAEFGDVAFYLPSDASTDAPTLVYDLPFADDGPTDVRVYDDRGRDKFATTASGGTVNIWIHAYHTGYQFDGAPVIDSGRLRVRLDRGSGTVTAEELEGTVGLGGGGGYEWFDAGLTMGDYELADFSFERIQPTGARVRVTLRDTTDGTKQDTLVTLRRGQDTVLIQPVSGETLDVSAQLVFDEIASNQTTDPQPEQGLIDRSKL